MRIEVLEMAVVRVCATPGSVKMHSKEDGDILFTDFYGTFHRLRKELGSCNAPGRFYTFYTLDGIPISDVAGSQLWGVLLMAKAKELADALNKGCDHITAKGDKA